MKEQCELERHTLACHTGEPSQLDEQKLQRQFLEMELRCYENIARDLHAQAEESLMGGNLSTNELDLIICIETKLEKRGTPSPVVSALSADLEKSNTELLEMLRSVGDHTYGY